jgi:hypothetical protein
MLRNERLVNRGLQTQKAAGAEAQHQQQAGHMSAAGARGA